MFAGLATVMTIYLTSQVAYTWYFMIGACVTFATGALLSRVVPQSASP